MGGYKIGIDNIITVKYIECTNYVSTLNFLRIVHGKGECRVILIDYKDARPIYEQIVDKLRLLILNGALSKDEKIPSVRSLAMELSINPNTIQRAYNELERQGCIYTVKGRGNFVSDPEGLKDEYREEIFKDLDEVCTRAYRAGITGESIIDHIREQEPADVRGRSNNKEGESDDDNKEETGKEGEQS